MTTPSRGRLLLVEDEHEARRALGRALERAGFEVVTADSGPAATKLAQEPNPLHVAVVDIVLGEEHDGGLRVLEAIRARSPRVPVVMVTAFADVEKVKSALNFGASHLLEKPFRAAELVAIVDRLLAAQPDRTDAVQSAFQRARLTPRESEIALLALKGLSSPEIAQVLSMSDKTVRQHLSRVYEKLGVSSRGELVHLLFPI